MPRQRKPTRILELTGRLKHNRKRYSGRAHEPTDNAPLGGPPDRLPPEIREVWVDVAGQLVQGIALASDRPAFESLIRLIAAERTGNLGARDRGVLMRLYAAFGMTPADRSRVSAPAPQKAGNPFGGLGG